MSCSTAFAVEIAMVDGYPLRCVIPSFVYSGLLSGQYTIMVNDESRKSRSSWSFDCDHIVAVGPNGPEEVIWTLY